MPRLSTFVPPLFTTAALLAATATAGAQQLAVALCAAESSSTACQFLDPQTRLMNTGLFSRVDIINVTTAGGGTPTLAQLRQYNAIMCWTNSTPASNVAWGDVLADYVDAGGGVVVTVFANSTTTAGRNIAGRWQSGYEVIMDQSGNSSGANHTLGIVHQPTHPLMAGVTAFQGGTVASRPNGVALQAGATLIAEWSNGKVLVAVGANPQRVDLGFFPPHTSCSGSGWAIGGEVLMANALVHASRAAAYATFGAGCAGTTAPQPTLAPALGSRPILGGPLTVDLGNLPLSLAVMVLGFSDTNYGGVPLPLDLTPLGMNGCSLLTALQTTDVVAGAGGTGSWSITVPNDAALLGAVFFNQALVPAPGENPAGLLVTRGGRGRIGPY